MIDIHNHIIPGIDDGSRDEECTLKMAEIAAAGRIKKILATPHFSYKYEENTKERILEAFEKTKELLQKNNAKVQIYPGSEILISNDLPARAERGELLPLNHSRYLLIELPMNSIPSYTYEVFFQLGLQGFKVIVAHAERYLEIMDKPALADRLIEMGCILQLNAASIMGTNGRGAKKLAWRLLKKSMVSIVASDAHSTKMRPPSLENAFFAVARKLGIKTAKKLFLYNPAKILTNEDLL